MHQSCTLYVVVRTDVSDDCERLIVVPDGDERVITPPSDFQRTARRAVAFQRGTDPNRERYNFCVAHYENHKAA